MASIDFDRFRRNPTQPAPARPAPTRPSLQEAERALAFPAFLNRVVQAVRRQIAAYRTRRVLESLPDHLLRDAGLERPEIGVRRDLDGQQ